MTNFEKHKERLLKIADSMDTGIAVCNGIPYSCEDAPCDDCDFYCGGSGSCEARFIRWLYQEYEEKPKLSEKAYHFLKSLPDDAGIIIANGFLYVDTGGVMDSMPDCYNFIPEFPKELENGERHKVSEILKWEVDERND